MLRLANLSDLFTSPIDSHEHSMRILNLVYAHDSFMDSISVVTDMGCGSGLDAIWWAEAETRDTPPIPHNYTVYAVDRKPAIIETHPSLPANLEVIEGNFNTITLPKKTDVLWSHDSFQYSHNPLATLANWNANMNDNAMLALTVPQYTGYQFNRSVSRVYNHCYFSHTMCGLIYMLAVNGFDCNEAYFYKVANNPWIHAIVFKNPGELGQPLDPETTTWFDLLDRGVLHESIEKSLKRFGYVRQEDIIFPWLDRDWYFSED